MSKVLISLCIALACIALPVRAEAFCLKHFALQAVKTPFRVVKYMAIGAAGGIGTAVLVGAVQYQVDEIIEEYKKGDK